MQIRKSHLIGAVVAAAALFAGMAGAETFDQTVNDALKKDGAIVSQVQSQKEISTQDPDMIEAQRGGGQHGNPGGHPGGGDHRGPGGGDHRGPGGGDHRGPGHEQPGRGGDHGGDHRGGHPQPGHPGHPDSGRHGGDWGRWNNHRGWGHDRNWNWREGRWIWWGWSPWAGRGFCNGYYYSAYNNCSNAAWADNNVCKQECDGIASCNAACDDETRNAINSCEFSYRSQWNCPVAVVWPPIGVVIRIP